MSGFSSESLSSFSSSPLSVPSSQSSSGRLSETSRSSKVTRRPQREVALTTEKTTKAAAAKKPAVKRTEDWAWDYAGQKWYVKEEKKDELEKCRALLIALTNGNAAQESSLYATMDPSVREVVEKKGMKLVNGEEWKKIEKGSFSKDEEIPNDIDAPDIPVDEETKSLPWDRVKAFALGETLATEFRKAQENHTQSMRQWFLRPDGSGSLPDDESDVLCQLLRCADEQTDQLVLQAEKKGKLNAFMVPAKPL